MKLKSLTCLCLMAGGVLGVSAIGAQQMRTYGELEVSDSGSAVFTVALTLPPTTGVSDPTLNLVYKSQSGNGLFGVGWTLTGLPSITPCVAGQYRGRQRATR